MSEADALCVVCAGERHRDNVLQAIGSSLEAWVSQVKREKAVYHVLNMCSVDVTRKVLVAEAWCPVSAKPRVQEALREAAHTTSASVTFRLLYVKEESLMVIWREAYLGGGL